MVSATPNIGELVHQLGLRAPLRKVYNGVAGQSAVSSLYGEESNSLFKALCNASKTEIKDSPWLRSETHRLFIKYGPLIWDRPQNGEDREHLLKAGEQVEYPQDLYFDDPDDFNFMSMRMYQLVVVRALRYRENHSRQRSQPTSSGGSDPTWVPMSSEKMRVQQPPAKVDLQCFATDTAVCDHQDATELKKRGVWLGDYHSSSQVVTNVSWDDTLQHSFEVTSEWKDKGDKDELQVRERRTGDGKLQARSMKCAACTWAEHPTSEEMMIEDRSVHREFRGKNHVGVVWTYQCYLDGRKVFAAVSSTSKHVLPHKNFYAFYKVGGGYTEDIGLVSASASSGQPQNQKNTRMSYDAQSSGNLSLTQRTRVPRPRPSVDTNRGDTQSEGEDDVYEDENDVRDLILQQRDVGNRYGSGARRGSGSSQIAEESSVPQRPKIGGRTYQAAAEERDDSEDEVPLLARHHNLKRRSIRHSSETGPAPSPKRARVNDHSSRPSLEHGAEDSIHGPRPSNSVGPEIFDEAYDVTPGAQSRSNGIRNERAVNGKTSAPEPRAPDFFTQLATPQLNEPHRTIPADHAGPPADSRAEQPAQTPDVAASEPTVEPKKRPRTLNVQLVLDVAEIRYVRVDTNTSVEVLFAKVEKRLHRKTGGMKVQSLGLMLPGLPSETTPSVVEWMMRRGKYSWRKLSKSMVKGFMLSQMSWCDRFRPFLRCVAMQGIDIAKLLTPCLEFKAQWKWAVDLTERVASGTTSQGCGTIPGRHGLIPTRV